MASRALRDGAGPCPAARGITIPDFPAAGELLLPSRSPASAGAHPEPVRPSSLRSRDSRVMGPPPCPELACTLAGGRDPACGSPSLPPACPSLCWGCCGGRLQNREGRSGAPQHQGEQTLLPPRFKRLCSEKRTYGPPGRPWGRAAAQRGRDSGARVSLGPRWCRFSPGVSVLSVLGEAQGTCYTRLWVMTQPGAQLASRLHDPLSFPSCPAEGPF